MRYDKLYDQKKEKDKHLFLLIMSICVYIWSAINPADYLIWFLDSLPAVIFALVMVLTYRHFTFTTLVYVMIFLHITILVIGAKYMYQLNPLFEYFKVLFNFSRNHFDRLGHFAQGLVPALMAKELLLRMGYLKRSKMFYFIVMCIVLAFSAVYELLEFSFTLFTDFPLDVIMAYQGDPYDSQWDMIMALIGGLVSLILLRPFHNRAIRRISSKDIYEHSLKIFDRNED